MDLSLPSSSCVRGGKWQAFEDSSPPFNVYKLMVVHLPMGNACTSAEAASESCGMYVAVTTWYLKRDT